MKLTTTDIEYLKKIGNLAENMAQIEEATRKTIYELSTGEKISTERAIELLGREKYLSGIQRSAFHRTASREIGESGVYIYFDSSRLFKSCPKKTLKEQIQNASTRNESQTDTSNELKITMKWYENRNPNTGETYWWTQRDKNGNCYEIRKLPISKRLRLFVNDFKKSDHDTLGEAQQAAEAFRMSFLAQQTHTPER